MKSIYPRILISALSICCLSVSPAQSEQNTKSVKASKSAASKPVLLPLLVQSSINPIPFMSNGRAHLVYELQLTNVGNSDIKLQKIEILSVDESEMPLATFTEKALRDMLKPRVNPAKNDEVLHANESRVVFLWIDLDMPADKAPQAIKHRLTAKLGEYPESLNVLTVPTKVEHQDVPILGSPLPPGEWLAANGPSNTSAHRRALIPLDGRPYIGQRFAIDFIQTYANGKTFQGDPKDNKSYKAYGQNLYAVADGTVTHVKEGIPENIPPGRAQPINLDNIGGNCVIIDIGEGRYTFYAHMQPGSVLVKVGDKIRKGQVLGKLGNSGNSDEPHLHFHVCNANSALASDGLPYCFVYDLIKRGKNNESKKNVTDLPLEDDVVAFPPVKAP